MRTLNQTLKLPKTPFKRKEINEEHYVYSSIDDSFKCEIDDKEVQLQFYAEIMDTRDFDESADDSYPFGVSIGIIPKISELSPLTLQNIKESCGDDSEDFTPCESDFIGYFGCSVYLDDSFFSLDMSNSKFIERFTINQAKLSSYTCRFSNKNKKYPLFADEEQALNYINLMITHYGKTIASLIGFYLDKPVNLIGETGWSQIKKVI